MPWRERIPPIDFDAIRDLIPILDVLDRIGWHPTVKCGRSLKGNCPLHSLSMRTSTSFSVKGCWWYCWTCRTGGDVVELWGRIHGQAYALRAALDLCAAFDVPVPRLSS